MKSKTILFGGSGFIGANILERYPDIISVGRSPPPSHVKNKHITIEDIGDLRTLDNLDFDKVIFLIGNSDHHKINKRATMGIDHNVTPLKKALFYMQNRELKKFVCFSTILVYDAKKYVVPVDESQPTNPYVNDYIFSKFLTEEVAKFHSQKVPIVTVRLTNIYGPTKLVRPDIVTNLIQQVLSPNEASVQNINPVRDFLFTYDAADAIIKLLDTDYTGVVNVATGVGNSIETVVKIIENISGRKIKVLNEPVTGHMKYVSDITRLTKLTGWKPKYSIEEGIKITYERMKEWADECRWWEAKESE
jgi:nucleoside-diphosphate-sugar epimerase